MPNEPTPVERISPPVNKIGEVFFIEQRITQRYDPIKKKIVTLYDEFEISDRLYNKHPNKPSDYFYSFIFKFSLEQRYY